MRAWLTSSSDSGMEPKTKRAIWELAIAAVSTIAVVLLYIYAILNGLESLIIVESVIGLMVILALWERRSEDKAMAVLTYGLAIIGLLALFNLLNILFNVNIYQQANSYLEVKMSITVSMFALLVIPILYFIPSKVREQLALDLDTLKEEWSTSKILLVVGLIIAWVAFAIIGGGAFLSGNNAWATPITEWINTLPYWASLTIKIVLVVALGLIIIYLLGGAKLMNKMRKTETETEISPLKQYLSLIGLILIGIALFIFFSGLVYDAKVSFAIMSSVLMILFFISFYVLTTDTQEGVKEVPNLIYILIGCVAAPLLIYFWVFPLVEGIDAQFYGGSLFALSGQIYQGQTSTNYFSYVFYILLQSPAPSLMIGFMVFGAISVMISQNIGARGQVLSGVAASVVTIIPLVFIMAIFSGQIPPPELLAEILGDATASLVFALAQLSAFILVLSIIMVFITAGRMLGSSASS